MPRYIDADKLLKEEQAESFVVGMRNGKSLLSACKNYLKMVIDNAPTADVVEVVRCGRCKHKRIGRNSFGVYFYCGHPSNGLTNIGNVDKDFCSYGEGRNDGTVD